MTETQFKSPLFDASATWNGFSYQGKVGLYVCLKLILDSLNKGENIDEFCTKHSIEFEWLEDFSILKNNKYISHHQVKHYNEDKFSKYIDAFVTILSRQQGRISENDLFKYVDYYAQINTKNFDKDNYIERLIKALIDSNLIDQNRFVINYKVSILNGYNSDEITGINSYLADLISIKTQFSNGHIYVHTSKQIKSPEKDLCTYTDIKKSKVSLDQSSKKTLKSQRIICSFDTSSKYKLALDDETLTKSLMCLAGSILEHINPSLNLTPDILIIYIASIKESIDKYVALRHQDIKTDVTLRLSEKVKRKLSFTDILTSLRMEIIDESKEEYWELICRENFENAFQKQIDLLGEKDSIIINNLNRYYKITYENYIKAGKLSYLLKALKPHVSFEKCSSKSNYFQQHIAAENDITNALLNFFENLSVEHDDCFLFPKDGQTYQASTITVSNSNTRLSNQAIDKLKIDFKDEFIRFNSDIDFIVIDSPNKTEFSGHLKKFVEVPNTLDYEVTDDSHITSTKDIIFVHYELAQEKLNE